MSPTRVPAPRPTPRTPDPNFMESLARGLAVLRSFSSVQPSLSVAEAAQRAGLSRASARRCLYTLQKLGYSTGVNGVYALTPQVLALGYAYLGSAPLARVAQPILERVTDQIHESCSLAVLADHEVLYVARSATRRIMSVGLIVGSRLPAFCTSMGRVLLAGLSEPQLTAYLDRLAFVRHTPYTVADRASLVEDLKRVRTRGYSLVDQELELGLRSIAVPVFRPDRSVVAAINSGVQSSRVQIRVMTRDYLPVLRAAADDLGTALAHTSS